MARVSEHGCGAWNGRNGAYDCGSHAPIPAGAFWSGVAIGGTVAPGPVDTTECLAHRKS